MKCPKAVIWKWDEASGFSIFYGACLLAECAWWSSDHERCDIALAAQEIYKLNKNLANVANLMPRGGGR